jgi:hypothetical protein
MPPIAEDERATRRAVASFLRCEAFELRYRPDVAHAVSGLASRVDSNETIEDLLANVGATARSSPYALRPRDLRALLDRRLRDLYARVVAALLGLD